MPKSSWIDIAAEARRRLDTAPEYGEKLKRMDEVAAALGLSRGTLNNYLKSASALPDLVALCPALGRRHKELTPKAVLSLERWSRLDAGGMCAFAAKTDRLTDAAVLSGERAARAAHRGDEDVSVSARFSLDWLRRPGGDRHDPYPGSFLPDLFGKQLMPTEGLDGIVMAPTTDAFLLAYGVVLVGRAPMGENLDPAGTPNPWPHWSAYGARNRRRSEDKGAPVVFGVMEVPDYALAEMVRREAKTIFARAALMASRLPVIFLVCRNWAVHAELQNGLPELPEGMVDEAWDEWVRGLVFDTRRPSPWYVPYPRVYHPAPGLGIIVPLVPPEVLDTQSALAGKPAR